MLRVALTGGIATGKSYCLAAFAALGAPTIDADALARDAVATGTPGLMAIRDRFGSSLIDADGTLNRGALARIVFADEAARRDLEAIVHPIVYEGIRRFFMTIGQDQAPAGIAAIPLLFETGRDDDFDVVIATLCSRELQISRLVARGLAAAEAIQRINAQMPADRKASLAGHVIDTNGSFATTDRQVLRLWEWLSGGRAQP
jgi:dephospho-CoA kinase